MAEQVFHHAKTGKVSVSQSTIQSSSESVVPAAAITLLYHDVIAGDDPDTSGFSGTDAAEYKLTLKNFSAHLAAIGDVVQVPVVSFRELEGDAKFPVPPLLLAFDDGGVSALEHIAPLLEEHGWRGCFFVTTDRIDTPAFLSRDQIRQLHARGHVIGSHSCSHPARITDCDYEQLLDEWGRSRQVLEEILSEPVTAASIPGGFYSDDIVKSAAECGYDMVFTSEPVMKIGRVHGCTIVGRYSLVRGDDAKVAAEFVKGARLRRFRQFAYWNTKKLAKAASGPIYPWFRSLVLKHK